MSTYTMSQKDVLRVGLLSKYISQPDAQAQIELTSMALPVTLLVDTYEIPQRYDYAPRKRINVRYAITAHGPDVIVTPLVYHSIQSLSEVIAGGEGDLVNISDLLDIVKSIEERVAFWDGYCLHGGSITTDIMEAIYDAWSLPDWVDRAHLENDIIHISGDIKDNAIFPDVRVDAGNKISARQMTWAIRYLIERGLLPEKAFEMSAEDWDDEMADKVFQVCLFGEVVMD